MKICDFGLSRAISSVQHAPLPNTPRTEEDASEALYIGLTKAIDLPMKLHDMCDFICYVTYLYCYTYGW